MFFIFPTDFHAYFSNFNVKRAVIEIGAVTRSKVIFDKTPLGAIRNSGVTRREKKLFKKQKAKELVMGEISDFQRGAWNNLSNEHTFIKFADMAITCTFCPDQNMSVCILYSVARFECIQLLLSTVKYCHKECLNLIWLIYTIGFRWVYLIELLTLFLFPMNILIFYYW